LASRKLTAYVAAVGAASLIPLALAVVSLSTDLRMSFFSLLAIGIACEIFRVALSNSSQLSLTFVVIIAAMALEGTDAAVAIAGEALDDGVHSDAEWLIPVATGLPGFVEPGARYLDESTGARDGEVFPFGLYHLALSGKGRLARFTHRRRKSTSRVARPRAASRSAMRL